MGFLRKQRYFVGCAIFNGLVYLLLLGDVIATPLISDAELVCTVCLNGDPSTDSCGQWYATGSFI